MKNMPRKVKDKAFLNILETLESNCSTGLTQFPAS